MKKSPGYDLVDVASDHDGFANCKNSYCVSMATLAGA
jgi:hypothetical protein